MTMRSLVAAAPAVTGLALATVQIIAGAGLTGGGTLAADRTLDVAANADGSIVVNANDIQVGILASDAQHGVRGGGTQHSAATTSVAGFMSSTDKTKLDSFTTAVGKTAGTIAYISAADTLGYSVSVKIINTGASLSFASSAATVGDIRVGNATTIICAVKAAGGDLVVLATDGSNQITIGDTTNFTAATLFLAASASVRVNVNGFLSIFNSTGLQLPTSGTYTMAPSSISGAAPNAISFAGGATSNTGGTGGSATVIGGAASAASGTHKGGPGILRGGAATAGGTPLGGDVWIGGGAGASRDGNVYHGKTDPVSFNWQSMGNGMAIENCSAAPAGNPTGAGFLYAEAGALKYRGTSGTTTTIAVA